jgi:Zn-dependent protease/predicted transcriptional regulator
MRYSLRLFRAFGVDVKVHWSFVFIVAYFAYLWGVVQPPGGVWNALYGILLVIVLFILVVIHELTHSRVAIHYGVKVSNITLLPIGGVSQMEEIPEEPRKELAISGAGPLSNVVIGLIMLAFYPLVIEPGAVTTAGGFFDLAFERSPQGAYLYIMLVNGFLAVFNLLPAFPLDGGRVFRALLALRMDRARATRVAVVVGQALAIGMAIYGILGGGIFLILIAIFIFFGAQAEGGAGVYQQTLEHVRVKQVVNTEIHVARRRETLGELAARLFHTYQADFPVINEDDELEGILTRDRLIAELGREGSQYPVELAMRTDFPAVGLEDPVLEVMRKMREGGFKAVPVVDRGTLVGLLSLEDISEVYSLLSAGGRELLSNVPEVQPPSQGPAAMSSGR